jgi:hypothetical protein
MMMGQPTQCELEFPFGPPATQIEHGKSTSAETLIKKAATFDAHFASSLSPIKQGQLYRFAICHRWLWATRWPLRRRFENQKIHKPDDPQCAKGCRLGLVRGFSKADLKRDIKCAFVGGDYKVKIGFASLAENVMMVAMAV